MSNKQQVQELRKLFPVTEQWTYLLNGSIHPCARPVGEAMRRFLAEWENGGEAAFHPAFEAFGKLREQFARLIHADARNIVITESTTAAINLAAQLLAPRPEKNVVVTDLEFMTNTYLWLASRSRVDDVRFIASHEGGIRLEDLATALDKNTALVHTCAVTVGSGFRYDLKALTELLRSRRIPLILDAAQALGVLDVDVSRTPVDFLAGTASKWLMGPAGVGFLYVADSYLGAVPPTAGWLSAANLADWDVKKCVLHDDARRFQGGIPNLVGVVGALAGLELVEEIGQEFIERRVRDLTTYLIDGLGKLGVDIWTRRPWAERAGIVFFRVPGHQDLHRRLKEEHIYCGCFLGGIRVDPGVYNTPEEIDRLLAAVRQHRRQS